MISDNDVEHIAKLARLGLKQKEIEKFQKELSSVLDYFQKLKEVDISEVKPTSHSIEVENIMRQDQEYSKMNKFLARPATHTGGASESKKAKILLDLAPEIKDGYLKVKSIL